MVISLVERGWQAARLCSLALADKDIAVTHYVKGTVPDDVHALVPSTSLLRLCGVPKTFFWPCVLARCTWLKITRRLHGVLVDNERSFNQLDRWIKPAHEANAGPWLYHVQMGESGCELRGKSAPVLLEAWREALEPCR